MNNAPAIVTIAAALVEAALRLEAAGIAEPRREARLVLALAMQVDPGIVLGYPERTVDAAAQARLAALLARRARHEPFSRLKGSREFWSLDFALSPATLDPRPDSETLIEAALAHIDDRNAPLRIVDFGTGTGCLLLALLHALPQAAGIGVDISIDALNVARRNAARLGLEGRALFKLSDWDQEIRGKADVILANPPYIPSNDIERLAPEVAAFEPRQALDGGPDGLAAYRVLAPAAQRLLTPRGIACFEVGSGQAAAVAALLGESGLKISEIRRDLAGIERCLVARL